MILLYQFVDSFQKLFINYSHFRWIIILIYLGQVYQNILVVILRMTQSQNLIKEMLDGLMREKPEKETDGNRI